VPHGSIDVGFGFSALTAGYQNWNGQFVRGVLASDPNNTWAAEVANLSQFGAGGILFALGNTHVINDDWYVSTAVSSSDGGFFLPRARGDVVLNRKFLEARNLVIGVGVSAIKAKDVHRDLALTLGAAYYFDAPWVIEGGVRINRSNPGSVITDYYNVAVTYGRDKERFISLRFAHGQEGYQVVGDTTALSNFSSRDTMLTWREWVQRDWGVQMRVGEYRNPYYQRIGGEFSLFWDF
jgi:YaiO family outer membrane protein